MLRFGGKGVLILDEESLKDGEWETWSEVII